MVFRNISRENAISRFGAQEVYDAEIYALTKESKRSLDQTYNARIQDQSQTDTWLIWRFKPTYEMLEGVRGIDAQH